MAGRISCKSWIVLGAVTIVVISSLVPVAVGQISNTTTGAVTTGAVTTGAVTTGAVTTGAVTTGAVTTGAVTTGAVTTGTGGAIKTTTPKLPAGQAASEVQKRVIADLLLKCPEVATCPANNTVNPTSTEKTVVCNTMKGFLLCIKNNCKITNSSVSFTEANKNYQDCSGCALQVSALILLLAVIASRLF